jgi:outer membrane protein assembly factor BamB
MIFAQDALQWRGKDRDGIYDETGLLRSWPADGPKLIWHYDSIGEGYGSAAVVSQGMIYVTGMIDSTGYLYAFNTGGELAWSTSYGGEWNQGFPGTRATPLIKDGKIYLMSGLGKIVCLSADSGSPLWSVDIMKDYNGRNIMFGITENLLIDGDKLFCTVGGEKNNVIALNKNTGKLLWSSPGNGDVSAYCSPMLISLSTLKILVTMTEKSILGLDAASGEKLWSHYYKNVYGIHPNTPIYKDGYLYCVSGYGYGGIMLKLSGDGKTIDSIWKNTSLDSRMGGVVLLNDRIYGLGDKNKGFHCLDWITGKEIASQKYSGKSGNIISADGLMFTYDEGGEAALFEPTDKGFKKISAFKVPYGSKEHWAQLVIEDGKLFIRHGRSLMVYDIKN